jgi:hypothetical protein
MKFSDANGGKGIIRKSSNAYAPTQPNRVVYVPAAATNK